MDAVRLGIQVRDALVPIADKLFEILSFDGATEYFSVDAVWGYLFGEQIITVPTGSNNGEFIVIDSTVVPQGFTTSSSIQGAFSQVTDWEDYTPVVQGFVSISNVNISWRRIGDTLYVTGSFQGNSASASFPVIISLPVGLEIDSSITSRPSFSQRVGGMVTATAGSVNLASTTVGPFSLTVNSANNTNVYGSRRTQKSGEVTDSVFVIDAASAYISGGDVVTIDFSMPIQGWTNGLDGVVENKTLDATTKNDLEARISTVGGVTEDEFDFIDGSCTNAASSICTFKLGIFTQTPKCKVEAERDGVFCNPSDTGQSNLSTKFSCFNHAGTNLTTTTKKIITCSKTGVDINKNVIQAATLQGINSTDLCQVIASDNDNEAITASTEDIPFKTIEKDNCGVWTNAGTTGANTPDSFTANKKSLIHFEAHMNISGNASLEIASYINGVLYKFHELKQTEFNRGNSSGYVPLNQGEIFSLRLDTGRTLATSTTRHHITITEMPDFEALVENLSTQQRRTVYLKDIKPAGTHGGTFTAGDWRTRVLNSVSGDTEFVTLLSNQFTLQPGKYEIEAEAPAYQTTQHKVKLRNISDSIDALDSSGNPVIGKSMHAQSGGGSNNSTLQATIIITSPKTFEIQHIALASQNTNGFGNADTFSVVEVFTVVKITKVPN